MRDFWTLKICCCSSGLS